MSLVALSGNVSGTGTLTIAAPNTNSNYTLTLPTNTATLGINGPAFSAYASTTTTLSAGTWTKINYATEDWDTNSNFASNRFTPTIAGYYQINAQFGEGLSTASMGLYISIYKNGTAFRKTQSITPTAFYTTVAINAMVYCNGSTDYIEIYAYTSSAYTNTAGVANWFDATLVRGA